MPGTVPGGEACARHCAWCWQHSAEEQHRCGLGPGLAPRPNEDIDEDLATTTLGEDVGMSPPVAAEMHQKDVTQPSRPRGDRRGHFSRGVSQAKNE